MNFRILIVAIFANCALASAQLKTNVEGSKFQFKEIVRHDVSPVESQGRAWYLLELFGSIFLGIRNHAH